MDTTCEFSDTISSFRLDQHHRSVVLRFAAGSTAQELDTPLMSTFISQQCASRFASWALNEEPKSPCSYRGLRTFAHATGCAVSPKAALREMISSLRYQTFVTHLVRFCPLCHFSYKLSRSDH